MTKKQFDEFLEKNKEEVEKVTEEFEKSNRAFHEKIKKILSVL